MAVKKAAMLEVKDLHVKVEGKEVLKGISFSLERGKTYAIMGPNGSGKSTLANVLIGSPKYEVTKGNIKYCGKDLADMSIDERARAGIFLSFQNPVEIPGVAFSSFLRAAVNAVRGEGKKLSILEFSKMLEEKAALIGMSKEFFSRSLNEGFSGGEKKRAEIVQMLALDPELAILDEIDSGLDIDALKAVAKGINSFKGGSDVRGSGKSDLKKSCGKTLLLITHYKRLLEHVRPDVVIIMAEGKIVKQGSAELVDHLEEKGYGWIEKD
ncbi:MAG TPA: Fe-S cluster assembly ATPase SufC [Candidatus Nanoarchaeia archaeon]|nr:Fe-S cluster assembly ATPase SufC [Candidatus Nanoarchaeia archaeon]